MTARAKPLKYEPCYLKSETGNPLTKFVNLCQTPEERRDKYRVCRFFGLSSYLAMRMRDWHWTKIYLLLHTLNHTIPLQLPYDAAHSEPDAIPAAPM